MDQAHANRISTAEVVKKQKGIQDDNAAEGQLCTICKKFKHRKKFMWMNRHHQQLEGHQKDKKTLQICPLADDPVLFDEWAAKKKVKDKEKNKKKYEARKERKTKKQKAS